MLPSLACARSTLPDTGLPLRCALCPAPAAISMVTAHPALMNVTGLNQIEQVRAAAVAGSKRTN